MPAPSPLHWDIFCRVIDNHGDLGVCWRLARDLAGRGHAIRLWVDDPAALAWMAPQGHPRIALQPWREDDPPPPGEVVVEAFGCDPPAAFAARMAAAPQPPVWINLEYLSAEAYVERSHRLASPVMSGPAAGLRKWFFYPGFTPATGGLLREPGLVGTLDAQDAAATLAALGVEARPGERVVSVFCYPNPALSQLPARLADVPTLLLATPGHASQGLAGLPLPDGVRLHALPWLAQPDYDRLLAACGLNFVRGEDSFVRAQWAGRPFVWQIYPQHDGVHAGKLQAFLDRQLAGEDAALAASLRRLHAAWNGLTSPLLPALPSMADWAAQARRWRARLLTQVDLTTQLLAFVAERR